MFVLQKPIQFFKSVFYTAFGKYVQIFENSFFISFLESKVHTLLPYSETHSWAVELLRYIFSNIFNCQDFTCCYPDCLGKGSVGLVIAMALIRTKIQKKN